MPTQHEIALHCLAHQLFTGDEAAVVRARCDASGVDFADVEVRASVFRADLADATERPSNQLVDGESIVKHGEATLACGTCSATACDCRRLDTTAPRSDAHDSGRRGRSDAGVMIPPELPNPAALMFGEIDLTKARAWLGDERFAELKAHDEAELEAQEATARTGSTANCYRGVLVATISEAEPDLADRAATESMTWLRAQYRALPNSEPTTESKTDMASNIDQEDQRARARMNSKITNAWHTDIAKDEDDVIAGTEDGDEGDDQDETGTGHERAMKTLDALRAKAAAGTLTTLDARRMGRLALGLAAAHEESGPVDKTDAADDDWAAERARQQSRVTNAWRG